MTKKKENKKITTIEGLADLMEQRFKEAREGFKADIESLAQSTQKEFLNAQKERQKIMAEIESIKHDLEDIKLRLGEHAFRFEVKHLEERVRKIEKTLKIQNQNK